MINSNIILILNITFLFICSLSLCEEKVDFSNFQLYQVKPLTKKGVVILQEWHNRFPYQPEPTNGLTFMNLPAIKDKIGILVPPKLKSTFTTLLSSVSRTDIVIISNNSNFNRNIKRFERQMLGSNRQKRAAFDLTLAHNTYMRYSEIMESLKKLHRKCQHLRANTCSLENIGVTYGNRSLTVLKISKQIPGKQKRKVWIDGGIHAREWISPATVLYIADTLISKGLSSIIQRSDEIERLLNEFDFVILPLFNPDGYEYSHTMFRFWRKNREPNPADPVCVGTDLNRNFGHKFGGLGSSGDPCQDIYRGTHAFSARENDAARRLIEREHRQADSSFILFLTYHSYGQYILMPYGYKTRTYPARKQHLNMNCAAYLAAQEMYSKNHRFYVHGTSADVLYEAAGGSDDWAAGSLNIPYALAIELPDDGMYGFLLPPAYIQNVGDESVFGLITMLRTISDLELNSDFFNTHCPKNPLAD